jgi:hypothetical protein
MFALRKYTLENLEVKLAFNGNVPCGITGTDLIGPSFRETGGDLRFGSTAGLLAGKGWHWKSQMRAFRRGLNISRNRRRKEV